MKRTHTQPVSILRKQDGTFQKGITGNPSGRPRGARTRLARALDDLAAADAVRVLGKAIEMAKDGDLEAVRLILRHSWPVPKGRPVDDLELPPLRTAADAVAALGAIMEAVTAGTLSVDEARDLSEVVEVFRKTHELSEIERRVSELESRAREARSASSGPFTL